ncbi:feruloyl-CoA synthase [Marinospirillum alkaliphilum]|uniref:Feruloyl-CoA synthase n=1 Tax=Marinospirillum alkaliphilum DSM 21637 TaxID=1122209 RepID=A0A1K1TGI4_9GAMM|nr:feruloyl-CoA synthase [Marinospirillum alkaliphilum]SFW99815.1 feruloyl-CoA synthase [Marinospirillum alkaliphilum DSM 21637]
MSALLEQKNARNVRIGYPGLRVTQQQAFHLEPAEALQPLQSRLLDSLVSWAELRPHQTFVAMRQQGGDWQHITYAEMLQQVRCLATGLRQLDLGPDKPLAILSGNDLHHLTLAYAAMYAGIPYCPVSPAYSLLATDYEKLAAILEQLTPGALFVTDTAPFAAAISAVAKPGTPLISVSGSVEGFPAVAFADLQQQQPDATTEAVFRATGPDTLAKILYTSGSTSQPKGVMTTNRMLCANQQMLLQTFPCFAERPPVLVDWLPWNHVFGGSHNIGIVLYNGGTLYMDEGRPTPQLFAETLRNLREISPTAYLTVPRGWEELVTALEQDADLRNTFFKRMQLFFFAAAGLSDAVRRRLDAVSLAHCGERIRMMAGLGMTETAPSCTFTTGDVDLPGYIGLPAPGCQIRLVPVGDKLEARYRGPHVTPGYWRAEQQTRAVFDEQGYFCSGDAIRFVDPERPELGLMFDGRISEDFKLSTGVFVSVGPLRTRIILAGSPVIQDVVITAPDQDEIGLLVFPRVEALRELPGAKADASLAELISSPAARTWLQDLLQEVNLEARGSSSRVAWACLLADSPSINKGEVTDKGSINQRAVLQHRAAKITALYAGEDRDRVDADPMKS